MKRHAFLITIVTVILALAASWALYERYRSNPWTRDALVQGNIVSLNSGVSGVVDQVLVELDQEVEKGEILVRFDRAMFQAQRDSAAAAYERTRLASQRASPEADPAELAAALQEARAALELAELHLVQTEIRSPVNGYVVELTAVEGGHLKSGDGLVVVLDKDSLWVDGFFPETVLAAITPGQPARVHLMGRGNKPLEARVKSVSWGIYRQDGQIVNALPETRPVVEWIRLPQRFPVRVELKESPAHPLRIGQTATVQVLKD